MFLPINPCGILREVRISSLGAKIGSIMRLLAIEDAERVGLVGIAADLRILAAHPGRL